MINNIQSPTSAELHTLKQQSRFGKRMFTGLYVLAIGMLVFSWADWLFFESRYFTPSTMYPILTLSLIGAGSGILLLMLQRCARCKTRIWSLNADACSHCGLQRTVSESTDSLS